MAQETKRFKVDDDNDALVKSAPTTLAWVWEFEMMPKNLTYQTLLDISGRLRSVDKVWISDCSNNLLDEYKANMSDDERVAFETSHILAQEFELLKWQSRLLKVMNWKVQSMTMNELVHMEDQMSKCNKS